MPLTNPTETELPPVPSVTVPWFNADGTPTPETARFFKALRSFLADLRNFIDQEHP